MCTVALHVAPSITLTVFAIVFATYTVFVASLTAIPRAPAPASTCTGFSRHPLILVALHVLPSMTETSPDDSPVT